DRHPDDTSDVRFIANAPDGFDESRPPSFVWAVTNAVSTGTFSSSSTATLRRKLRTAHSLEYCLVPHLGRNSGPLRLDQELREPVRRGWLLVHCTRYPPSTVTVLPVTQRDSSEAR